MTNGITLLALATIAAALPAEPSEQGSHENRKDGTAASAVDDRLFRDLGGLQPNDAAARQAPAGQSPRQLISGDGFGQASQADSWTLIGQQMWQVQSRLRQADDGPETLRIQQQIVAQLQQLLLQAPRPTGPSAAGRDAASQGGRSQSSMGPPASSDQDPQADRAADSPLTKPEMSATDTPRKLLEQAWGHLPAKIRQQLQSVGQEDFLPQYAPQIEAYYRSLSASVATPP